MVRGGVAVSVLVGQDAELLDGAARYARQPFAFVNILNEDGGLFAVFIDFVRNHRRGHFLDYRNRVDITVPFAFHHEGHVIVDVHQIDAPQRVRSQLGGHQEILVAQRLRFEELRPYAVHHFVLDDRFDRTGAERDFLYHTFLFLTRLGRVEDNQTAGTGDTVVPGNNPDERARPVGERLHVEGRVREPRTAAVKILVLGTVRVHVHHEPREVVDQVGIFPTGVHHAAVVHHGRVPVVVLVEGQTAQVTGLRVVQREVAHRVGPVHARHPVIPQRGIDDQPSVGQISTVGELHIRFRNGCRNVFQPRAVGLDFEHVPATRRVHGGEQHAVGIPVHVHVGYGFVAFRLVDDAFLDLVAAQVGQLDDRSAETAARCRILVRPVVGLGTQSRSHHVTGALADVVLGHDDFVDVQQRIGHQDFPLEGQCFGCGIHRSLVAFVDVVEPVRRQGLEFGVSGIVFLAVEAFHGLHVGQRLTDGRNVEPFELGLEVQHLFGLFGEFHIAEDAFLHIGIRFQLLDLGVEIFRFAQLADDFGRGGLFERSSG